MLNGLLPKIEICNKGEVEKLQIKQYLVFAIKIISRAHPNQILSVSALEKIQQSFNTWGIEKTHLGRNQLYCRCQSVPSFPAYVPS